MTIKKKNCPLLEASESLKAYRDSFNKKQQRKLKESAREKKEIEDNIYFGTKYKKERANKAYNEYCNNIKSELLNLAIKGIYVGALEENTALTDNGILLANNLVDNFIKESGGPNSVLNKISGKTYALDFIKSVVEGTYESIIEADEIDEDEEKDNEGVPEEKKSEMFDELNNDGDISNAVNIIAKRITDAEEEFIKKNNEDKKALDDIANKFSERIKNIENDDEIEVEKKDKIQEESSRTVHRIINNRRENRIRNVFEQIVINLTESILKDENLKELYSDNGRLDMPSVIEASKCIYGFLETVNTLQLQRITPKYIEEALSTI